MNKSELVAFEEEIANEFNAGRIHAPVHLSDGNEEILINIFRGIRETDWVLCSWRSHYHCLLKGVPRDLLRQEIMAGRSISLCFPEHRIFSSAIVAGILPIAVGIGLAISRDGSDDKVFCFIGDMTAETGTFAECLKYVRNFGLPVKFIIEDNGKSILTSTKSAWNSIDTVCSGENSLHILHYKYDCRWPHAGAGRRVKF